MRELTDPHLDPSVAARYDDAHRDAFEPLRVNPIVDVLAEAAAGGSALEFAIGTGRVALPLAERGVDVSGIDHSAPMLDQLHAKPGSEHIHTSHGDMISTRCGTDHGVVFLLFNTVMNLQTQDDQVRCFANAGAHLRPGGRFVIEVMVPEVHLLGTSGTQVPFALSDTHLGIDEYPDRARQTLISHHLSVGEDGTARRTSVPMRYVWPSELDLMAQLAGLHLEHRWATWDKAPFTSGSTAHVSVWTKT